MTNASVSRSQLREVRKSLRLHQWAKNVLVFAPAMLAGRLDELPVVAATLTAFIALGLVASATYLINDILDAPDDRLHWAKKERPIAAGRLPVMTAAIVAAGGLIAGVVIAASLSWSSAFVLLAYVVLTLAYSLGLKRIPLADGLVLAILFTLRLALGVAAANVAPSSWLFVFSLFLFSSLTYAKRYTELVRSEVRPGEVIRGRGYRAEDTPLVLAIGVAAGLGAVLIMVLYIIEDAFRQSFYGSTLFLWGFPPLIFLIIARIWLVTARGEMNDDPVEFLLRDPPSLAVLVMLAVCFGFAWLGNGP